jgi:hypothetical protein
MNSDVVKRILSMGVLLVGPLCFLPQERGRSHGYSVRAEAGPLQVTVSLPSEHYFRDELVRATLRVRDKSRSQVLRMGNIETNCGAGYLTLEVRDRSGILNEPVAIRRNPVLEIPHPRVRVTACREERRFLRSSVRILPGQSKAFQRLVILRPGRVYLVARAEVLAPCVNARCNGHGQQISVSRPLPSVHVAPYSTLHRVSLEAVGTPPSSLRIARPQGVAGALWYTGWWDCKRTQRGGVGPGGFWWVRTTATRIGLEFGCARLTAVHLVAGIIGDTIGTFNYVVRDGSGA